MAEQSLKNHGKLDWRFHFFVSPVLFISIILAIRQFIKDPNWMTGWGVVSMLAAGMAVFLIRIYALKVQDRLIRLEEQLRLQRLAGDRLGNRAFDLTADQAVGLRFASDAEAPALAEKALANGWNRKQIKEAIQVWRPDHFRV
jgi:hypothetical protein